jgi:rhamnose utilization protein RhaD (predicted bifunctional aldolase and dehydrogenase)
MMIVARYIAVIIVCLMTLTLAGPVDAADKARQEYDKMVEESVREADAYVQEKQEAQQQAAEDAQGQQDAALQERVQAESDRIQAEMDRVNNRGMSYNFTQGMKDDQLRQLQDQLDRLVSDPKAYFGIQ